MNLATRPFYNDRAVHLAAGGARARGRRGAGGRRPRASWSCRAPIGALTLEAEAAEREAAAVSTQTAGLEREMPRDATGVAGRRGGRGQPADRAASVLLDRFLQRHRADPAGERDAHGSAPGHGRRGDQRRSGRDRPHRRRYRGVHPTTRSDRRLRGRAGPAGRAERRGDVSGAVAGTPGAARRERRPAGAPRRRPARTNRRRIHESDPWPSSGA